ncbi:MAG: M1 family peptidase [Candidatus Melainabacteria bacterium]|nr:MAG: M1 family peptidase [Candidatus Melainabacteria bacterium]
MKQFCAHCRKLHLKSALPAYFLPQDVVPATLPGDEPEYRLRIHSIIKGADPHFSGSVTIAVDVRNPVDAFPINAVEMQISDVTFEDCNGVVHTASIREDAEKEQFWFHFDEKLPVGRGLLSVGNYRAAFNKKLKGFYLSSVKGANGETYTVGCTQSEPADFRRWVPSFDQPGPVDYKCKFSVVAEVPADQAVRSNGDDLRVEYLPSGNKVVYFETSNRLPTYVIAQVVGDLESSDPKWVGSVEVRVWAPPGNKHLMDFALEVVSRGLPLLEEFHGQKYPNRKLDLIAVPGFSAGAMENDGMFTFRMEYVLIDRLKATVAQLLQVAIIVLHELDHTWDGNRHTMEDWSQLSLNELRATFMSYLIADKLFPEFKVWDNFAQGRAAAMDVDSLKSTRSVVSPVRTIKECEAQFDVITYNKGSAVLRMMQTCLDALVKDGFQSGMQAFNNDPRYDWGNATTEQLWDSIGEVTGLDVRGFMEGWTKQSGFPNISVKRAGKSSITVRQARFTLEPGDVESEQLWQVPLFVRAYGEDGKAFETLLHLDEREQVFDLGADFQWLVVNAGGHGFYHTSYDDELFEQLAANAQEKLTGVERFILLNDAWAALQTGRLSASIYMKLLLTFKYDRDPNVWRIISMSLGRLGSYGSEKCRETVRAVVEELTAPLYTELGWKRSQGESPQTTELRGRILAIISRQRLPGFERLARKNAYLPWLAGEDVDGDVLNAAIFSVATEGDAGTYAELFGLLNPAVKVLTPQQITMVLTALTLLSEPALAENTLSEILNDRIDQQMAGSVIGFLFANSRVRYRVWAMFRERFAELADKLTISLLLRGLNGLGDLDRPEDAQAVQEFLSLHAEKLTGSEVLVSQIVDRQHLNIAMRARCEPDMETVVDELLVLVRGISK